MLTPAQRATTMTVEEEYIATHQESLALYRQAQQVFPSGVVHDGRYFKPFPFYATRASGTRKWDVDGNEYIDCWSGHGALILGHNHPAIVAAVTEQMGKSFHYSACHELELTWGQWVQKLVPSAERVRFTLTGTETTLLALRVARAYTGRSKIIKFQGHFHGVHDYGAPGVKVPFDTPMSAGIPQEVLDTVLLAPHNDIATVRHLIESQDVAAVILEPAGAHSMTAPTRPGFLQELRQLTQEKGVVLIFDEIVTGFRFAPGGAQEYYGVIPDLTALAKAMAGGLPGAALVGKKEIMELIAFTDDPGRDRRQRVADQGTHSANPVVAAAGIAALQILATGEVQAHCNKLGEMLRQGLNEVIKAHDIPGCAYGDCSIFHIYLGQDCQQLGLDDYTFNHAQLDAGMGPLGHKLHLAMLLNGVDYVRGLAVGFLNAAMTPEDMEKVIYAFDRSLGRLKEERARDC